MRAAGLTVEVESSGTVRELPPGIGLTAYRVVQEALTNALKHGSQKRAQLCLEYADRALVLEVTNPAGDLAQNRGGHGLVGMRERVQLYDGTLQHGRQPDGSYRLRVQLPVAEESA